MSILQNTDYVVLIAFLIFVGILLYFKVPSMIGGLLDQRAAKIRNDLDEARALREEAQSLLASYERKQREMTAQAEKIVETAQAEAQQAAADAKAELERSVARRLKAADEQLASAEAKAISQVRERSVSVAVDAARAVIAEEMSKKNQGKLIDEAISDVGQRLN